MPAQLTPKEGDPTKYLVPDIWKRFIWARDFINYPDPEHQVLKEEYDWKFKDDKGVVYGYINHVEGTERLLKVGRKVSRKMPAKPFTYYAFAIGAAYLHNNPGAIRDVRAEKGITGAFVVNYVNSIDVYDLFDPRYNDESGEQLVKKLKQKAHIIPVTYGALLARVFNATSGISKQHHLLVEPREPKIMVCPNPNCQCAFELLSKNFWEPGDEDYDMKREASYSQHTYRKNRDTDG